MAIAYRSRTEIEGIRRAARTVMEILALLRDAVHAGVTTGELDALARAELARRGATSNFAGYTPIKGVPPFPGVICASVNEEVVHGIPGPRVLAQGDIVALDFGAVLDGWHGDSAITVAVGQVAPAVDRLLAVTQEALRRGVAAAQPGKRVFDISRAIQSYVEGEGYSLVRGYGGPGVGGSLHEDPSVPNDVEPGQPQPLLRASMVICIQPMGSAGAPPLRGPNHHCAGVSARLL